jgi:Fe(3+) dicitrate transport protein
MKEYIFILILFFVKNLVFAQEKTLRGQVLDMQNQPISGAWVGIKNTTKVVQTNAQGQFILPLSGDQNKLLVIFAEGKQLIEKQIVNLKIEEPLTFQLEELSRELDAVTVQAQHEESFGIRRLRAVENFGIYEAKKTEVVLLKDIAANLATNNPRQVYAKVVGLNIWESDGVGLQLGIGGRGLSPNRTANFNTRQNGYDISADALGYPESYYTPPTEALDRIEVVRGAASLQYGTQFGGMLNFRFKTAPKDKKIELNTRQSIGSWGFLSSFNSLGGTVGKWNYVAFYQRKQGDGWRPNSAFGVHTFYAQVGHQTTSRLSWQVEFTSMDYLAQQAGGLTDAMFEQDARQSVRSRNWFKVDWKMASVSVNYTFSERTKLNIRNFGLWASRRSLGNLERINVDDRVVRNRTLISGDFRNLGSEVRLLHRYGAHNLLVGMRLYRGTTTAQQGEADGSSAANFSFLNPQNLENSDFVFPNQNQAVFIENIWTLSPNFTLTPGVRYERIKTTSEGYYKQRVFDFAGNLIVDNRVTDNQVRERDFFILGLGASWKPSVKLEMYANFSQNYRAINFTDLRIVNPNFAVDPNIQDEKGYTADFGVRGNVEGFFNYDVSVFMLRYNGKIGQILRADQPPLFLDYRLRKNVADARNVGLEAFGELDILKLWDVTNRKSKLSTFVNLAVVDARYINTEDNSILNKQVEMVPPVIIRSGLNFRCGSFLGSWQWSYVGEHFSDATNARRTSTAVEGLIPSYAVMDFSARYAWRSWQVELNCNNLLDARYFTRRAEAYPGPGIIPSDGRGFYATLSAIF